MLESVNSKTISTEPGPHDPPSLAVSLQGSQYKAASGFQTGVSADCLKARHATTLYWRS